MGAGHRYFTNPAKLVKGLSEKPRRKTYFDLDVDYFFEPRRSAEGTRKMIPDRKIRQLMDPRSQLMATILQRDLQGITFALEPTYCGGLPGCFKAMSIVMETLIDGDLLGGGGELEWR